MEKYFFCGAVEVSQPRDIGVLQRWAQFCATSLEAQIQMRAVGTQYTSAELGQRAFVLACSGTLWRCTGVILPTWEV